MLMLIATSTLLLLLLSSRNSSAAAAALASSVRAGAVALAAAAPSTRARSTRSGGWGGLRRGVAPCPFAFSSSSSMIPAPDAAAASVDRNARHEDPRRHHRKHPTQREPRKKSHCTTICLVPPPATATEAWDQFTRARRQLRDPGFYRWPPHANILYPFLELGGASATEDDAGDVMGDEGSDLFTVDVLEALGGAARRCRPFGVTVDGLGTFGGTTRGVLWAYPRSYSLSDGGDDNGDGDDVGDTTPSSSTVPDPSEPLVKLQSYLEEAFPTCAEGRKSRRFHPHMTLSHFESLDGALAAKRTIEEWWKPVRFDVTEVYVLRRVGDGGQFEIAATVPLGPQGADVDNNDDDDSNNNVRVHDPPVRLHGMPSQEEDWVYEARMRLKARRNNNDGWRGPGRKRGGRRRRNGRRSKEGQRRRPDTPEEIEAKRAARRAKREALEKERGSAT